MISGCQKCQSNLAGTWFSHCSLLFLEDFAMDEDQKPTMLRDLDLKGLFVLKTANSGFGAKVWVKGLALIDTFTRKPEIRHVA